MFPAYQTSHRLCVQLRHQWPDEDAISVLEPIHMGRHPFVPAHRNRQLLDGGNEHLRQQQDLSVSGQLLSEIWQLSFQLLTVP